MDVVLAETSLTYKITGGVIDLFFFLGPKPLQLIQQCTDLIGKPFLPPRWSLGYHQCRDGYRTANYSLQVAMNYTDNALPLDVMWSDIDWMEDYLAFTFAGQYDGNRYSITDVIRLTQWLHKRQMKRVYIVDSSIPALLTDYGNVTYYPYELTGFRAYVLHPAGDLPIFNVQWPPVPVAWLDWTNPAVDQWLQDNIALWSTDVGLPDGIWLDMNEPSAFCEGTDHSELHQTIRQSDSLHATRQIAADDECARRTHR